MQILAALIYFAILLTIGFMAKRKNMAAKDYLIGGRQMGFWLTAFAAHASDASTWLFLGLPAMIFSSGLFNAWMAIGLVFFMFLNWHFIAPRVRVSTEQYGSFTFSSFFESRFADTSGTLRMITAVMLFLFYTIYISAGMVGLGLLLQSILGVSYGAAVGIGVCIILPYLFAGGYVTLAWTDLFQALFLLAVIVFVPLYALGFVGGTSGIEAGLANADLSMRLFPDFRVKTLMAIASAMMGWGLGYFGQPHIVTKFMGIKCAKEMPKAKYVGVSWQILTFGGAVLIGLEGVKLFGGQLTDPELLFVRMTDLLLQPFFAGLMLCAVLAATISTVDSQILVLASSLSEDFYKRIWRKDASSKEILWVSRLCVVGVALLGMVIAQLRLSTIYGLVFYAWSGLGASFGPLMIAALFFKRVGRAGALGALIGGGLTAALWPLVPLDVPALVAGFVISFLSMGVCHAYFSNE